MIPNTIHFIFGLKEDFGGKPFSFIHYLAVKSAYDCNRPDAIKFYYKYEPQGEWWEKSKPYLTLVKVEPPTEIFGKKLLRFAHQTDVLRLEILLKEGGIYLDMDVICLNSFKPLLRYDCVLGKEGLEGLCNAVILAKPNAEFLNIWYKEFQSFDSNNAYAHHAVTIPAKLASHHPTTIHVQDKYAFFWPLHRNPSPLWEPLINSQRIGTTLNALMLRQSYTIHLWEKLWWDDYLKNLTPEYIQTQSNLFSKTCRRFIDNTKNNTPKTSNRFRWFIVPLISLGLHLRAIKAKKSTAR